MAEDLKVGLIGLDTSHVPTFTKNLNTKDDPEHIAGAKVVAGYSGGSPDFEMSISRVAKFTADIHALGVDILASPEEVAAASDLVFITAVDGRTHLDYLKRIAKYRRPTFVDKPLAIRSADAKEMFDIAARENFPLMSCSSLRYADTLTNELHADTSPILGCEVFGPMAIQPTQPGLFWYGIHMVEIVYRVLGAGCREVHAVKNDDFDMITGVWGDGRMACLRGSRKGHNKFGAVIHREKESRYLNLSDNKRSYYASMLDAILSSLPKGKSGIAPAETMEIIRFIEAANLSRMSEEKVMIEKA